MHARFSQLQLTEQQNELYKKQYADLQNQYSKLIDAYNNVKQYMDWLQYQYDLRNTSLIQAQAIFDLMANPQDINSNPEDIKVLAHDLNADLKQQFSKSVDTIFSKSNASEKYAELLKIYAELERNSNFLSSEAELKQQALETEINRAKKLSKEKKKQKNKFKEQRSKLESEIKELNNKLSEKISNNELKDLANNYREFTENLAKINYDLTIELNKRTLQLESLQIEIENLKQKLDENELLKTISNLNIELKNSFQVNDKLDITLKNSEQDNQLLKQELNIITEVNQRQRKEMKDQETTIKSQKTEIQLLREELARYKKQENLTNQQIGNMAEQLFTAPASTSVFLDNAEAIDVFPSFKLDITPPRNRIRESFDVIVRQEQEFETIAKQSFVGERIRKLLIETENELQLIADEADAKKDLKHITKRAIIQQRKLEFFEDMLKFELQSNPIHKKKVNKNTMESLQIFLGGKMILAGEYIKTWNLKELYNIITQVSDSLKTEDAKNNILIKNKIHHCLCMIYAEIGQKFQQELSKDKNYVKRNPEMVEAIKPYIDFAFTVLTLRSNNYPCAGDIYYQIARMHLVNFNLTGDFTALPKAYAASKIACDFVSNSSLEKLTEEALKEHGMHYLNLKNLLADKVIENNPEKKMNKEPTSPLNLNNTFQLGSTQTPANLFTPTIEVPQDAADKTPEGELSGRRIVKSRPRVVRSNK